MRFSPESLPESAEFFCVDRRKNSTTPQFQDYFGVMRLLLVIAIVCCGCSERDRDSGSTHDRPPDDRRPTIFPDRDLGTDGSDASTDLSIDGDSGVDSGCATSVMLDGALEGERQFSSCEVNRREGIVTMSGTAASETFVIDVQLADRESTDTFEEGSGVAFRLQEEDGVSNWLAFGEACDFDVTSNESLGGDRYRVVGVGDCGGRNEPTSDSEISRSLRFQSFSFDAEYTWP